jgi:hypothetical protein
VGVDQNWRVWRYPHTAGISILTMWTFQCRPRDSLWAAPTLLCQQWCWPKASFTWKFWRNHSHMARQRRYDYPRYGRKLRHAILQA